MPAKSKIALKRLEIIKGNSEYKDPFAIFHVII